jgi:hypothetical protein
MASLYISEFGDLPFVSNGVIQAPGAQDWVTDQKVGIGASSTASNPFNAATDMVVLSADAVCSIAWAEPGETATATASNFRLPANVPMLFGITPGMSVSVVTNT